MSLADELLGEDARIVAIRQQLDRLLPQLLPARRPPPILLQGETGTGKGLLARVIHRGSPRGAAAFVDVDCAAIPETLLEAELFGVERGAFTGAHETRPGLLRAAQRGTIFLDEIGLMPAGVQAKLLKVVEDRAVRRLGSTRVEPLDVLVVSATNEDLARATHERRFREDLYHRLAAVTLHLPPLRERGSDIALLAGHYLARACVEYGLPLKQLRDDARASLMAYPWPGNVRELANVMERVTLLAGSALVTTDQLGLPASGGGDFVPLKGALAEMERERIQEALEQSDWNVAAAAAQLGVPRSTLRYAIGKHGLAQAPTSQRRMTPSTHAPRSRPSGMEPQPTSRSGRRSVILVAMALTPPVGSPEPPQLQALLDAFTEKILLFGGRLAPARPAWLLGIFGAPGMEDAPGRAASAALAVEKAADHARTTAGASGFTLRTALHQAELTVVYDGELARIAEPDRGAVVRVLEEMLEVARPHSIVVGSTVGRLLERAFHLERMSGPVSPPGPLYRLLGREPTGFGIGGRRLSPFLGRSGEMDLLQERLAHVATGRGHVFGIVGEPGVGKSRLLYEFRESLSTQSGVYLEGRCSSSGTAVPYLPIVDLLRRWWDIAEGSPSHLVVSIVHRCTQEAGFEATDTGPYLLRLLGIEESTNALADVMPETVKRRTFDILRQVLLNSSQQHRVALVIEDLHWIDKASEELLAFLVDSIARAPVLFVSTYRPGYRPPWIDRSYVTQVSLPPLSASDSLAMARSLLPDEPEIEQLALEIVRRVDGNPFFLEELAWARRSADPASDSRVPPTVEAALGSRIDRLPTSTQRTLEIAAVLGREVPIHLLELLSDEPGELSAHLGELLRLEFLYEQSGPSRVSFTFKHALTQDVAYARLTEAQRALLHGAAGKALERLYAGRHEHVCDRLAFHFARTEEHAKALEYLTQLALKSERAGAFEEALAALREALPHAEHLPAGPKRERTVLDLVIRHSLPLMVLGRIAESRDVLRIHEERLTRLADPRLSGAFYFWLGHTLDHLGDRDAARQASLRAVDEASLCGDDFTRGRAHANLTLECFWSGEFARGVEHGRVATRLLSSVEDPFWRGHSHWFLTMAAVGTGDFTEALQAADRARQLGEAGSVPRLESYGAFGAGWVWALKGETQRGMEEARRGLALATDPLAVAIAQMFLGIACVEGANTIEAVAMLQGAAGVWAKFGLPEALAWTTVSLSEALALQGSIARAEEVARKGLDLSRQARFPYGVGSGLRVLGRITRIGGAFADADRHLGEALQVFKDTGARYEVARTLIELAELERLQGNRESARNHLTNARAAFDELDLPKWVQRTDALAASLISLRGNQQGWAAERADG